MPKPGSLKLEPTLRSVARLRSVKINSLKRVSQRHYTCSLVQPLQQGMYTE